MIELIIKLYLLGAVTDFLYDTKRLWGFSRGRFFISLMYYNLLTCFIFPYRIYIRYNIYLNNKSLENALNESIEKLAERLAKELDLKDNKEGKDD